MHLGHWAGNIENMLALQDDPCECFFFIADWHMLTTHYDRTDELPGFVYELCSTGSRPASTGRATIYRQSDLPEVAEMTLLLGMITPLGWLERVPSFKERLRDMAERDIANFGLLGYPVLQTVDIAIVGGELVPVGEDQVSHVELTREIVRRFNRLYGDVLVEPQPLLSASPLIPGSDGRKMSKSLDNAIWIRDAEDPIRASVRSFVTDPEKVRRGDPDGPEICPIFALHPDILAGAESPRRARLPDRRAGLRRLQDDPRRSVIVVLPALPGAARRARGGAGVRRGGTGRGCGEGPPRARATLPGCARRCTSREVAR